MSVLNRIDVIPSEQWSAIPAGGQRLVWATADDGKIATFWLASSDTNETTSSGWALIRTDVLPYQGVLVGGPPPYRGREAGLVGAEAFVNDEFFLWVYDIPAWGPPQVIGEPAPIGVEGEPLNLTLYPKNSDLTPPA